MPGFIELKDVRKIYRMGEVEIKAVDGINFSIERGEFVVIVGPSGAGKTTVLNILGGMDQATTGEGVGQRQQYCRIFRKGFNKISKRCHRLCFSVS